MPNEKQTNYDRQLEDDTSPRVGLALAVGAGAMVLRGILHGAISESGSDSERDSLKKNSPYTTVTEVQEKYQSELKRIGSIESGKQSVATHETLDVLVEAPNTIPVQSRPAGIVHIPKAIVQESVGKDQQMPPKDISSVKGMGGHADALNSRNK